MYRFEIDLASEDINIYKSVGRYTMYNQEYEYLETMGTSFDLIEDIEENGFGRIVSSVHNWLDERKMYDEEYRIDIRIH